MPRVPTSRRVARAGGARTRWRASVRGSTGAKPVPGFGDPDARLLIVGLAPAAHGGNRTGRVFTGDRSGDFLFGSLHRTGYANQPTSEHRDDGLALTDCFITATVKCAPPQNKPTPAERDTCRPFLERELALLARVRVVVALGQYGWDAVCAHYRARDRSRGSVTARRPHSGTGARCSARTTSASRTRSPASSRPSMLDAVFRRAREIARSVA